MKKFPGCNTVSLNRSLLLLCLLFGLALAGCTKPQPVSPYIPPRPAKPAPPPRPEPSKFELWQQLVAENRFSPVEAKLASVNNFFNQFDFVDDTYLWGTEDYWATLRETLAMSAGDCEDITIAKYFTLKDLQVPGEKMRLTYVISIKTGKPHLVLTYQPSARREPVVLDTMNNYLFPVSRRPDLVPVYSFNEYGYWLARVKAGWKGEHLGSPAKITSWQDLLRRMKKNGDVYSDG